MLVVGQQNWVLRTDVLSHVLSHFSLCGLKEKNKYSCIKVQSDKTAIDNLVYTAKVETQTWRANVRILLIPLDWASDGMNWEIGTDAYTILILCIRHN